MPEDKISKNVSENLPSPEGFQNVPEQKIETREKLEDGRKELLKELNEDMQGISTSQGNIVDVTNQQNYKREREKKIEIIMEDGMKELYANLPPNLKAEFRIKGEKAANEINGMLDLAKIKVKKIISIIKEWLAIIPSVNRFFLEQTAKIKADEIMKMKEHEDHN